MIPIKGHLTVLSWDERVLRVRPRGWVSAVALLGRYHGEELVVMREHIVSVRVRRPGLLTNGCLVVRTRGETTYRLHFRRSQAEHLLELAAALGMAERPPSRPADSRGRAGG
jgi:hypothetical protein